MPVPEPLEIPFNELPQALKKALETNNISLKKALARAALPLVPGELVASLVYLSLDSDKEVSETAKQTLKDLPFGVLESAVGEIRSPGILDALIRSGVLDQELLIITLRNKNVSDITFEYLAATAKGPVLEVVAAYHARIIRHPEILRELYYNPNTPMKILSRTVENAVRSGADLSVIPGWRQIVESIMGEGFLEGIKEEHKEKDQEAQKQEEEKTEEELPKPKVVEVEPVPEVDEEALERALQEALKSEGGVEEEESDEIDPDEEEFLRLLRMEEEEEEETEEAVEEKERASVWTKIANMTVPEKVRLALAGTSFARSILIRDQHRPVYMAVLESPKLSEDEIVSYASDKGLPEEVIRKIARNREWVRLYSIKKALVQNPKTPPSLAMQFLNYLVKKDLQGLAKSHDVPGYIARKARQILQAQAQGKKKG